MWRGLFGNHRSRYLEHGIKRRPTFREIHGKVKRRTGFLLLGHKFAFDQAVRTGAVTVGSYSYGSPVVRLWGNDERIQIGNFTSIADDAKILAGGNHRSDWVTTYPFFAKFGIPPRAGKATFSKGNVVIGSDVWIGSGATILSGVEIGHGAIIGAASLVSRDVRPYSIVVGNPAKEIKRRFEDQIVNRLLAIRWWDWPLDRVLAANDLLSSPDIESFLEWAERDRS